MGLRFLIEGTAHTILAYERADGTCPVEDFLGSLQPRDRKKMLARIEFTANHGPPRNVEANKKVEGTKYFELKTHGHRIFWRWSRNNEVILMHGFGKRSEKIPAQELDAADRLFGLIENELRSHSND